MNITCMQCSVVVKRVTVNQKFCSRACYAAAHGKGLDNASVETICDACGASFTSLAAKQRKRGTAFCSAECEQTLRTIRGRANVTAGRLRPGQVNEKAIAFLRAQRGDKHPRWKGGKTLASKYIQVLAPLDYPFPESLRSNGRILEHRMLMEMHIGRALAKGEFVHHLNENHRDNRIENLEIVMGNKEHRQRHPVTPPRAQHPACLMNCGRTANPKKGPGVCALCRRKAAYRDMLKSGGTQ